MSAAGKRHPYQMGFPAQKQSAVSGGVILPIINQSLRNNVNRSIKYQKKKYHKFHIQRMQHFRNPRSPVFVFVFFFFHAGYPHEGNQNPRIETVAAFSFRNDSFPAKTLTAR